MWERVLECGRQRTDSGWSSLTTLFLVGSGFVSAFPTVADPVCEHVGRFCCLSALPSGPGALGFRCMLLGLAFRGFWGPELRSSPLDSRHFTYPAISPSLLLMQSHDTAHS